jgi:hypothetical protein
MKKQSFKMLVASFLVLGVLLGNAWAKQTDKTTKDTTKSQAKNTSKSQTKETSKPQPKDYNGTVKVTKDKDGNIKSITLKTTGLTSKTYNITLDDKGKELGTNLAGKKVIATGTVEKKKSENWLTLTKYSEVKPKETKKTSTETKKTDTTKKTGTTK